MEKLLKPLDNPFNSIMFEILLKQSLSWTNYTANFAWVAFQWGDKVSLITHQISKETNWSEEAYRRHEHHQCISSSTSVKVPKYFIAQLLLSWV